jgi:hypothetical protein
MTTRRKRNQKRVTRRAAKGGFFGFGKSKTDKLIKEADTLLNSGHSSRDHRQKLKDILQRVLDKRGEKRGDKQARLDHIHMQIFRKLEELNTPSQSPSLLKSPSPSKTPRLY